MQAHVGDQIRVRGHHQGDPDRFAEVVAVRGADGTAPFVIRWDGSDHEVLFFPGSDAVVEPLHSPGKAAVGRHS